MPKPKLTKEQKLEKQIEELKISLQRKDDVISYREREVTRLEAEIGEKRNSKNNDFVQMERRIDRLEDETRWMRKLVMLITVPADKMKSLEEIIQNEVEERTGIRRR